MAASFALCLSAVTPAQQPFTLQQVLSAPYATDLTPAPTGDLFAWVENAEGHHNLWIGGPHTKARQLSDFSRDDGLDLSNIIWSPNAQTIAFTLSTTEGPDDKPSNPAHLQRSVAPTLWIESVAGPPAAAAIVQGHAPLFSHDGQTIFFLRDGSIWSLALKDPQHRAAQLVIDRGRDSQLTLSPDGNLLAFVSERGYGRTAHSYLALFHLRTHTLTFPAPSTGDDFAPAFSRDGQHLAWLRSPFTDVPEFAANRVSATPWSIQLLDLSTGEAHTAFTPEADKPGSVLPHMATGEPHLFWTAANEIIFPSEADGWVHLYALDPSHTDQSPKLLTPGVFEVEDPSLNEEGTTLLYASNQATTDPLDVDRRHLWQLDLTHPEAVPIELTRGQGIETHPQLSANDHSLAALVSNAREPMHPALIVHDGAIHSLHPDASPATYPASQLVTPQQVLFPSADKLLTLHGQLFLPSHLDPHTRHAAILFFHGGPHRQMLLGYPGMDYYSNAYAMNQYLVSRGFIVLSVNYRCGIGYGLDFRQCEHAGADGATEYNDVLGAVNYLRTRADIDSARIGLWGGSYGGYLTALALARNSDLFAAGVDFHGVHEWILEDNDADWLRGSLSQQESIAALAHASSPMAAIDRWRSPVLLINGDDDPDVAYAQTPILADALRAHHVPVETLIFPDEVHDFILHRDWLASYQRAAAFFERTLHPER
ncbi:MAG TPA: prolyl oligopeptidase family serine peptidase [Acidobacteriaceae bacterium]